MKQLFVFVLCIGLSSGAYGAGENAIKLLESKTKRSLELVKFEPLNSKLYILIVKDKVNGYQTLLLSDEKEKNISVVNTFFSTDNTDMQRVAQELAYVASYNFKIENSAKLNALFNTIPKEYAITIQGANNNRTYIVSDPMCVHCQEELARIESRLEKSSVVMIPIGMLGEDSLQKAAEIQAQIRELKTPKDQIQLLRSIYSRAHKPSPQNQQYIKEVAQVTNQVKTLIDAVPFVYEMVR